MIQVRWQGEMAERALADVEICQRPQIRGQGEICELIRAESEMG